MSLPDQVQDHELPELLSRILAGEAELFRQLVRRFQPALLRQAYYLTGSWDDAEDITQTTLIRLYQALPNYKLTRPFLPWLYTIHRNNCRSFHYRRQLERLLFFRIHAVDPPTTSQKSSESFDQPEKIWECVQRLSWKQKLAFVYLEVEQRSVADAAEQMGCSVATVRVHLMRSKQNLRSMLRKCGIHDE